MAGVPVVEAAPLVAWHTKDLEPLVREFVSLTEELCLKHARKKISRANIPRELVSEIEKDLQWAERAKNLVAAGASELAAKQLNESQVPVELRPWIMVSLGSLQIAVGQMRVLSRLDKIIAQNEKLLGQEKTEAAAGQTLEKVRGLSEVK